ncbi:MAG: hypothetical protein AAGA64_17335 [Bacteroidota bacterium]
MVIIAAALAISITLYLVDDFILNQFSDRIEIGPLEVLSGFILVLLIGAFTVGWQVRTAAIKNPAHVLRQE